MVLNKQKFIARFSEEARDLIRSMTEGLLRLEKEPGDTETLNALFRSAHSIKGSARMMNLKKINQTAHKIEDVMDDLRKGKVELTGELVGIMLKGFDIISEMIDVVVAGSEIETDIEPYLNSLSEKAGGGKNKETQSSDVAGKEEKNDIGVDSGKSEPPPECAPYLPADMGKRSRKPGKSDDVIRIPVEKLDNLIKLMGEVIIGQTRFKEHVLQAKRILKFMDQKLKPPMKNADPDIAAVYDQLSRSLRNFYIDFKEDAYLYERIANDLQEKSLSMRMVPISVLFEPFRRTIRDMAEALGKKIDFNIEGEETELDKKIIEKIGDSLIHMIRNAVDHGIEPPHIRKMKGKPDKGNIYLFARNDGGQVQILLKDDGQGIPVDRIRSIAIKKGFFKEASMSDSDIVNLIFKPGFSTTEIITDMSGRGVGMDVVRENIVEDLKGRIRVETLKDVGTTFHIELPVTVAVLTVLIVSSGDRLFAFPTSFVREIIKVGKNDFLNIESRQVIKLRDQLIPVTPLIDLLKLEDDFIMDDREKNVLIIQNEKRFHGVMVDEVIITRDTVVKALPHHLKHEKLVSGIMLSARNRIINIINVPKLMEKTSEAGDRRITKKAKGDAQRRILVVDDSISTREIEKSILESYGYQVNLAGDGEEAINIMKTAQFDLVITDVEMPNMDGFHLTKTLRDTEEHKYTPIILVTSRDKEDDKRKGIRVGANAYITKGSFDQTNLIDAIKNLIGG